jgi:hypothetical protein
LLYPLAAFLSGGKYATGGFITVAGVTVLATLIIGLPTFLFFRRRAWFSWWQLTLGGAAIGFCCAVPFLAGGLGMFMYIVPFFSIVGAVHGLLFWLLAIWNNTCLTRHSSGTR